MLWHLPVDLGVATVIVNHLRTVATRLHEILPHYTEMPVQLITESLLIKPNHVFIIPEKLDLHVFEGELTQAAALEYASDGITVNACCPGIVRN